MAIGPFSNEGHMAYDINSSKKARLSVSRHTKHAWRLYPGRAVIPGSLQARGGVVKCAKRHQSVWEEVSESAAHPACGQMCCEASHFYSNHTSQPTRCPLLTVPLPHAFPADGIEVVVVVAALVEALDPVGRQHVGVTRRSGCRRWCRCGCRRGHLA